MCKEKIEPYFLNQYSRKEIINAWADWLKNKSENWEYFTITVVFKSGGKIRRPDRWESEYKNYVLKKIRRALEGNTKNLEEAIPFEDMAYYEFEETSIHRITSNRKPHHVHGLIPIRKYQLHKFWSVDNNAVKERIKKDIESIKTVQSVLIEPINKNKLLDWISYITKRKIV